MVQIRNTLLFTIIITLQNNIAFSQEKDSTHISNYEYMLTRESQETIDIKDSRKDFENPGKTKKISLDFIGYVKLVGTVDFGNTQNTSEFYPSEIPIYPTPREQQVRTSFDARQTRLAVSGTYAVTKKDNLHIYVEMDFYSTEPITNLTPHLRHAYAEYKGFLVGQWWSTMKNLKTFPLQVDFEGPNAIPGPRNVMIKYTHSIGKKYAYAIALESHKEDYTPYTTNPDEIKDFQLIPDLVGWLQHQGNWGNLRLSGVYRNISYTNKTSDDINYLTGWGLELSGVVKFLHRQEIYDDIRFGYTYGNGVSYYINDLRGKGYNAAPDKNGNMKVIPVMGGYAAYKHAWTKKSNSSIIVSFVSLDDTNFTGNEMFNYASYAAANYMFSPFDRMDFGIEFMYGKNVNKVEDFGIGYRVQAMATYHF